MDSSGAVEVVNAIASQMQVPAEHIWEVCSKQPMVDAVSFTIAAVILLLCLPAALFVRRRLGGHLPENDGDSSDVIPFLVAWSVGVLGVIFLIVAFSSFAQAKMNPEYQAVRVITKMIGGNRD